MLRTKFPVVLVVGLGALLLGSAVAYAGWSWNAIVEVEDTRVRTAWAVTDDPNGASGYAADIVVALPADADAQVIKVAPNESIDIVQDDSLHCTGVGIEASVTYTVSAADSGANGGSVSAAVKTLGGDVLGEGSGQVSQPIVVETVIPGAC